MAQVKQANMAFIANMANTANTVFAKMKMMYSCFIKGLGV